MPSAAAYKNLSVQDPRAASKLSIFYREAGQPDNPVVLLLHGFPTSSHQYRGLIDRLSDKYRVIAPDLPGFGFSAAPDAAAFAYTFDHLAEIMQGFVDSLGLTRYAIYVFDYGAPVGFRLALAHPERIAALISQNGNAYEEGLSDGWNPIRAYWQDPSQQNRDQLRALLQAGTTQFQYTHGEADSTRIAPESYTLDQHFLDRPGNQEVQLDLFRDYQNNLALYPQFQQYLRTHRPPVLAVWGRNDPFFLPAGAEAFRRDVPDAEVHLLDAGHFVLESHLDEAARIIRVFLARTLDTAQGAALFGELNLASVPQQGREEVEGLSNFFGFIPNLGYALGAEPAVLHVYIQMLQALGQTVLDPLAQQVALAAASYANAADYAVQVHATLAARAGASPQVIEAIRNGAPLQDRKLEAVRQFAAAIALKHTQVSDADVRLLTDAGYDRRAAVAIALAAGAKTLVNTVAHLARPALDPGFRPQA
uniref:Alpha/beta fold hydrolase n=1 Tax=Acidobacterium capsulatum TaxID=33075 RepID=A0A7V4XTH5_9BACT